MGFWERELRADGPFTIPDISLARESAKTKSAPLILTAIKQDNTREDREHIS
jgi:hypothetical protein